MSDRSKGGGFGSGASAQEKLREEFLAKLQAGEAHALRLISWWTLHPLPRSEAALSCAVAVVQEMGSGG